MLGIEEDCARVKLKGTRVNDLIEWFVSNAFFGGSPDEVSMWGHWYGHTYWTKLLYFVWASWHKILANDHCEFAMIMTFHHDHDAKFTCHAVKIFSLNTKTNLPNGAQFWISSLCFLFSTVIKKLSKLLL